MKGLFSILLSVATLTACANQSAPPPLSEQQFWHTIEQGALLLDVRRPIEFESGHLPGAINIPHDQIESRLSEIQTSWADRPIIVYCKSGRRARIAKETLERHGFGKVSNAGGYADLAAARPNR